MDKAQFDLNMILLGYAIKLNPAGNFNSKYTEYIKAGAVTIDIYGIGSGSVQVSVAKFGTHGRGVFHNYGPILEKIVSGEWAKTVETASSIAVTVQGNNYG